MIAKLSVEVVAATLWDRFTYQVIRIGIYVFPDNFQGYLGGGREPFIPG